MANLSIRNVWENTVLQIETGDRVLGGPNGKINQILTQLANRSEFNKSEIARAIALIGTNQQTATQQFALKTTSLTAGAGLSGGGVLRDNMTLSLGTPSKITATSQNSAVSNTHTHEIDKASTSVAGIVRLNDTLTSTSTTEALTAARGKALAEQAAAAASNANNRVAKSGDTMTGHLEIREAGGYSSVRLHNNGGRETRLETTPSQYNDVIFQLADRQGSGGFTTYCFPKATERQNIAYQSWVNNRLNEVIPNSYKDGVNASLNGKVSKSGDVMTGHLVIRAGSWSGVHLFNDGNRETRIETVPEAERNVLLKIADGTGNGFIGYFFPKATGDQMIAYQSWVNDNFGGKSTVSVLTGKIAHGGTIPLPHGFQEHQCKWIVSMHNDNPTSVAWDLQEAGAHNHYVTQVWTSGRVVHCRVYRNGTGGAVGWNNAEANYMIIGVK